MTAERLAALQQAVQTNCHIADARHAGDLTLCTYLLQMREFFRWEQGRPLGASLPRDAVGAWIAERERLWADLEDASLRPLPLGDGAEAVDPFDVDAVNARLLAGGHVYGAGIGVRGQAVFFLAELHDRPHRGGLPVQVAGRELARGLAAPPAVLDGRGAPPTVVVRRDALARWGWQLVEAYTMRPRPGSAFDAMLQHYGLARDLDAALPRWLDEQTDALVLHELGEQRAGDALGPQWGAMRQSLPTRRGELLARAVRDHLADLAVTLPALLDAGRPGPLHFWFAAYDGLREQLYPGLVEGYRAWREGDGGRRLRELAASGHGHFTALAQRVLARHAADGEAGASAIEAMLAAPEAALSKG